MLQAAIQIIVAFLLVAILLSEKIKHKTTVIIIVVFADLFFATQLNMNGSVVCERKVSSYQIALNNSPKKFPNSSNTPLAELKVFDEAFYPSWSNNAVFLKSVSEQNYNPFQLKSFEKYEQSADRYVTLSNPIFYFQHEENILPEVIKMQPNTFEAKVNVNTNDTLCLLQAYYPNWIATVNNMPVKISERANGLMAVGVDEKTESVVFQYKPEKLQWLLWLQFLLQGVIAGYLVFSMLKKIKTTTAT